MPKDWTRDISDQKNVELEVDLTEIFDGYEVPDSSSLKQAIGQELIDVIRNRTQKDERSWTGSPFKNYSEDYSESIEFKAYHKSKDEPNLTQSGDMLGLLTVKESDPGKVKLGWNDSLQSEKAHGHITGNIGAKRDFFGFSQGELEKLRSKFEPKLAKAKVDSQETSQRFLDFITGKTSIAEQEIGSIIDQFFGDKNG